MPTARWHAGADGCRSERPAVPGYIRIAREEIFGPVPTVLEHRNLDEAIGWSTDTGFGLAGMVLSVDPHQALSVAVRMDTGSVGINFVASNHSAPFGGRHDSGMGMEFGIEGLNSYLLYKSIHRCIGMG